MKRNSGRFFDAAGDKLPWPPGYMGASMAEDTEWMGDHYREMAVKLRDLARQTHFPSVRKALAGLAKRYDRIADRANSPHSPRTVDLPGKDALF